MPSHLVIRRESYVAGTRDRPEVGIFTQTHQTRHPVPWGRIATGEDVWMKWSGGPVVARARVQGFRQVEECTAEKLRPMAAGFKLHDLADYWSSLPPVFSAVVVYLEKERWLDSAFMPRARTRGESWVVLDRTDLLEGWLQPCDPADRPKEKPPAGGKRRGTRTVGPGLRFEVLRRDGFACTYCGRRPPEVVLVIDHAKPWSGGGPTVLANLRSACVDCNAGKGARRLEAKGE